MVNSVTTTSTQSTSASNSLVSAAGGSQNLDKQAFLKLLVAQLKNQDPLKPTDNTEFVAQLAQFSSLEATMGINTRLDNLTLQNQGVANSQAVGLMGSQATVRGSLVTIDGTGSPSPIRFSLDGKTATTNVTIRNQAGETVRKYELGAHAKGVVQLSWNGQNEAGVVQPAGTYAIGIDAKSETGGAVSVTQESTATVTGVSFEKGYPVLDLENGASVPVSDLLRVKAK